MTLSALDAMSGAGIILFFGVIPLLLIALVIFCIVLAVRAIVKAVRKHKEEENNEHHSA